MLSTALKKKLHRHETASKPGLKEGFHVLLRPFA